jgi:hypothetical protein
VHYDNDLQGLTIRTSTIPFTPKGGGAHLPPTLARRAVGNRTHGSGNVSPSGNADNVLLSILPDGQHLQFYDVPSTMPNGLYCTTPPPTMMAQQTYFGWRGCSEIGRPDGNLPLVTQNKIPVRGHGDSVQLRVRPKRQGSSAEQQSWAQWVSTLKPPRATPPADGTYSPAWPRQHRRYRHGGRVVAPWWPARP